MEEKYHHFKEEQKNISYAVLRKVAIKSDRVKMIAQGRAAPARTCCPCSFRSYYLLQLTSPSLAWLIQSDGCIRLESVPSAPAPTQTTSNNHAPCTIGKYSNFNHSRLISEQSLPESDGREKL